MDLNKLGTRDLDSRISSWEDLRFMLLCGIPYLQSEVAGRLLILKIDVGSHISAVVRQTDMEMERGEGGGGGVLKMDDNQKAMLCCVCKSAHEKWKQRQVQRRGGETE